MNIVCQIGDDYALQSSRGSSFDHCASVRASQPPPLGGIACHRAHCEVSVRLRRDEGRWVAEQEGAGPDTEDIVLRLRKKDLRAAVLGENPQYRTFNPERKG